MPGFGVFSDSDRALLEKVVSVVSDAIRAVQSGTAAEAVLVAEALCGVGISIEGLRDAVAIYPAVYRQARQDIAAELAEPAQPGRLRLVAGC